MTEKQKQTEEKFDYATASDRECIGEALMKTCESGCCAGVIGAIGGIGLVSVGVFSGIGVSAADIFLIAKCTTIGFATGGLIGLTKEIIKVVVHSYRFVKRQKAAQRSIAENIKSNANVKKRPVREVLSQAQTAYKEAKRSSVGTIERQGCDPQGVARAAVKQAEILLKQGNVQHLRANRPPSARGVRDNIYGR